MHHELLSPLARALAFLQHPSHHPRPHTLALRRHAFFACRRDLKLLLVFRAQVGCELTDLFLGGDNGFSVLQMRDGVACFAVLDVLFVCASYEGMCCGGCC